MSPSAVDPSLAFPSAVIVRGRPSCSPGNFKMNGTFGSGRTFMFHKSSCPLPQVLFVFEVLPGLSLFSTSTGRLTRLPILVYPPGTCSFPLFSSRSASRNFAGRMCFCAGGGKSGTGGGEVQYPLRCDTFLRACRRWVPGFSVPLSPRF